MSDLGRQRLKDNLMILVAVVSLCMNMFAVFGAMKWIAEVNLNIYDLQAWRKESAQYWVDLRLWQRDMDLRHAQEEALQAGKSTHKTQGR